MIPDRDYYADKDGKLTTNAAEAAIQVAVAGCFLDPRIADRYGIVSTAEPAAPRRMAARGGVHITKAAEAPANAEAEASTTGPAAEEPAPETPSSDEPAAAEPEAKPAKAPAKKAADQKGAKKK